MRRILARLRAHLIGDDPTPAPSWLDVADGVGRAVDDAWKPEHDQPVDWWPVAPAALPAGLLPQPGTAQIAYDPHTGALVRVPAGARTPDHLTPVED
ncbi:hypothetical protein [Xylanimonas ulmi]|uniref:Uncharacterized protein n=1 Tax=Xylanimonas ulmi TaxID=228973 RepID=A0A4Q7M1E7_9MICO|nr:hypothetical protein [Xylanibacterium ulmi]RZS61656.1 hypothetical protein EV386_1966 [Xylanibacterium ulmi]